MATARPEWLTSRGALARLVLMIVPAAAVLIGVVVGRAVGVRWVAAYYDPDYQYLLNGLLIAQGHAPHHIDHPGTPVQELAAAILLVRGAGPVSLQSRVLEDPESALTAISVCLRSLHAIALFALGVQAWRLTGSLLCAAVAQAASVLSVAALLSVWRVSPEPLVMTLAMVLACVTLRELSGARARPRFAAISGCIVGLGLATKVTFLPLAAVPLWGLRGVRQLALAVGAALATFVVAISPILVQTPAMLTWFKGVAVADGQYGTSHGHFLVNPAEYMGNLWRLVADEPTGAVAAILALMLAAHARVTRRWKVLSSAHRLFVAALTAAALGQVAQYVIAAKHPESRYLVPALATVGLDVAVGWALLRVAYGRAGRIVSVAAVSVLMVVGAAYVCKGLTQSLRYSRQSYRDRVAFREAAVARARQDGRTLVCMYGSSSPVHALFFADWWTRHRFGSQLHRMFPDELDYNTWAHSCWNGVRMLEPREFSDLVEHSQLLFQAPTALLPGEFEYDTLATAGSEGLYLARPRHAP